MQARNQSYLRRKNKEDIIRLLREQSRSYSDIARVLQLSNTAVAKIADDLMEDGLITRQSDTKGRKVHYSGLMENATIMGAVNAGLSRFFHCNV